MFDARQRLLQRQLASRWNALRLRPKLLNVLWLPEVEQQPAPPPTANAADPRVQALGSDVFTNLPPPH